MNLRMSNNDLNDKVIQLIALICLLYIDLNFNIRLYFLAYKHN